MILSFIKKIKNTGNSGFTLVEILVAVLIFSIVIGAVLGIFGFSIKNQTKSLNYQEVLDQTSYTMEYMSRNLRMARKDTTGECLGAIGNNYINPSGDSSIRFLNYNGKCQEFYLDNGQLKQKKSENNKSADFGTASALTSHNLNINSIKFIDPILPSSWNSGDNSQPRVTIFLDIEKREPQQGTEAGIKIQTTISQRNLDIP